MKNLFDYKYNLVCEGGAAGHMAHPFDLPIVKAPIDIVTFFDNLTAALKKDEKVFMKIDGVNASVRLNDNGEFVLDRMSMKPLDVIGVTKDKLVDRFGAGHGFLIIGATVLDIFNEALPDIQQELKMLGMNGGKRMLNIEYVSGTTNVIETDKKFLAIHGLLDIIQATPKKRVTKEVSSYNKGILNKLIDKVNAIAEKYGFTVYNQFLAMLDGEPDYKKVLSQDLEINISGVPTKKPVRDWVLNAVPVSSDTMVVSKAKGKIAAISKYVLQYVLNGGCISDDFQGDSYLVLSGFLMYYLTMILGAELLRCINSDLGRGDTQEGIVIRNSSLTGADRPVKITGAFILNGLNSRFRLNECLNESNSDVDTIKTWIKNYNANLTELYNQLITKSITYLPPVKIMFKRNDKHEWTKKFIINTDPDCGLMQNGELPDFCKDIDITGSALDNIIFLYGNDANASVDLRNFPFIRNSYETRFALRGKLGEIDFDKYAQALKPIFIMVNYDYPEADGEPRTESIKSIKNIHNLENLTITYKDFNDVIDFVSAIDGCTASKLYFSIILQGRTSKVDGADADKYVAALINKGLYASASSACKGSGVFNVVDSTLTKNNWQLDGDAFIDLQDIKCTDWRFLKNIDPKDVGLIRLSYDSRINPNALDDLKYLPEGVAVMFNYARTELKAIYAVARKYGIRVDGDAAGTCIILYK